jgi:hypothetical protein
MQMMIVVTTDGVMSELTYSGSFSNGKATPIFREQKEILCRRMLSYMHFLLKKTGLLK